jgi:hypothetical protein
VRALKPGTLIGARAAVPRDVTVPELEFAEATPIRDTQDSQSALQQSFASMPGPTTLDRIATPAVVCQVTVQNRGRSLLWENRWDAIAGPDLKSVVQTPGNPPQETRGLEDSYSMYFPIRVPSEAAGLATSLVTLDVYDRDVTTDEHIGKVQVAMARFPVAFKSAFMAGQCRAGDATLAFAKKLEGVDRALAALEKRFVFRADAEDFGYPSPGEVGAVTGPLAIAGAALDKTHPAVASRTERMRALHAGYFASARAEVLALERRMASPGQDIALPDGIKLRVRGARCPIVLENEDMGAVAQASRRTCGFVVELRNESKAPLPFATAKVGAACRPQLRERALYFLAQNGEHHEACIVGIQRRDGSFDTEPSRIDAGATVTLYVTDLEVDAFDPRQSPLTLLRWGSGPNAAFLRLTTEP